MDVNPFQFSGQLSPKDMINREEEASHLFSLAEGGHSARLVAPRRYGKTTLLGLVLRKAADAGMPTALVNLEGVLTLGSVVVRIERAYAASLRGPVRRTVDAILRSWDVGLSLGGPGFTATLQANPKLDAETVLLRLLELPTKLAAKTGVRSVIAFDEVQGLLRVEGADGVVRSVIQHQTEDTSYIFAGSMPTLLRKLFEDPSRPLLEHAIPMELKPLPIDAAASYIEERFRRTERDAGDALTPLVTFARGHPQRTMLLAHYLWQLTPRGSIADETGWFEALTRAYDGFVQVLRARWEALPVNEQRLAIALGTATGSIYEEATLSTVGLKRGSVDKALAGLEGRGEVLRTPAGPQLIDPLFERWLESRGTL